MRLESTLRSEVFKIKICNLSGKNQSEALRHRDEHGATVEPNIPIKNGRRTLAQSMELCFVSDRPDRHGVDLEENG